MTAEQPIDCAQDHQPRPVSAADLPAGALIEDNSALRTKRRRAIVPPPDPIRIDGSITEVVIRDELEAKAFKKRLTELGLQINADYVRRTHVWWPAPRHRMPRKYETIFTACTENAMTVFRLIGNP